MLNRYAEAYVYFQMGEQDENDPKCQLYLGDYYIYNYGAIFDDLSADTRRELSMRYYKAAGDQGVLYGLIEYARILMLSDREILDIHDLDPYYALAFKYLKLATEKGSPFAFYTLGDFFSMCKEAKMQAFQCYMIAAENNDPDALCKVGEFYENGDLVEKSIQTAEQYYLKSLLLDDTYANYYLGHLYECNPNLSVCSQLLSIYYYRMGAELQDARCLFKMAKILESDQLIFADISYSDRLKKAFNFYKESGEMGNWYALKSAERCKKKLQNLQITK